MNDKQHSQQSMSAEKKRKSTNTAITTSHQKGGSSQKKNRRKSVSPGDGEDCGNPPQGNRQGKPGAYGEQVEFEVGTKEGGPREGSKKVITFNGLSRLEIEERRAYKYRGMPILFNHLNLYLD